MKPLSLNFIFIIFSILITIDGFTQECLWSSHAGGTAYDGGGHIFCDKNGNTYISGVTRSNSCIFNTDTIYPCWFIVKYDNSGNEKWIFDLPAGIGPNEGEDGGIAMKIDTINAQLLVAGSFYNYLVLPDTILHGSKNTVFILKMDLDGNIIWYRTAGGTGDDQAFGITYDPDGNIYISGSNESDVAFGQTTIPRGGFLAEYDPNGNLIWAKQKFRFKNFQGSGYPYTEASPINLLFSNNSLLVLGAVNSSTVVFDTATFTNFGINAAYLASYTTQGNLNWVKLASGPDGACGSMTTDHLNNIFITGQYTKTGVFGYDTLLQIGNYGDCFIAKYDLNGNLSWVTNTKSSWMAWGWAITSSSDGSIYVAGYFHGTLHFGDIVLTSSPTANDMFLAKYATDGNNIGVRQYSDGAIYGVAVDGSDNVCFTGDFNGTLTIGNNTFTSRGQSDLFVAKCSPILSGVEPLKKNSNELLIYANPTTGICNITIPEDFKNEKSLTLKLFDSQGKVIQKVPVIITEGKITFDIRAQATGMYNVILSNGKKSYTGKIIFK
ncbi:MAG: T9SS type A sorting domain-containing protein [Bacteroidetes bacterium]|nr:T9SS type A sorting domain-containing protein [Bacteroidota bacterium]